MPSENLLGYLAVKQRVAIAGVVALRPDIIILDEATSMLDPEGRAEVIATIQKIKEKAI